MTHVIQILMALLVAGLLWWGVGLANYIHNGLYSKPSERRLVTALALAVFFAVGMVLLYVD